MVEDALRGVVRRALENTIAHGLPGDHHFYITFRPQASGVVMPDTLRERYPEEMTIILQHQFWNLKVGVFEFSVSLSFDNAVAEMTIPYAALTAFVDPSVKFGLQFSVDDDEATDTSGGAASIQKQGGSVPAVRETGDLVPVSDTTPADNDSDEDAEKPSADVVNLETFRKK